MNDPDHQLNRLFRAAAISQRRATAVLPPGFTREVLAGWWTGGEGSFAGWLAAFCPRAVLCSCAVATVCLLANISTLQNFAQGHAWHAEELRLVDASWISQVP